MFQNILNNLVDIIYKFVNVYNLTSPFRVIVLIIDIAIVSLLVSSLILK